MIQVRFSRGCSNGWCGWGRQEREQGRGNKTRGIAGPVRAPGFEMRQLLLAVIPSAARDLAGLLPKEILRCARDDSHIRCLFLPDPALRSEAHPSELQSLMLISYAVFCLKQKTH